MIESVANIGPTIVEVAEDTIRARIVDDLLLLVVAVHELNKLPKRRRQLRPSVACAPSLLDAFLQELLNEKSRSSLSKRVEFVMYITHYVTLPPSKRERHTHTRTQRTKYYCVCCRFT
jgi:hypothetical protein